jgi:hypothetical protein
MAAGKSFTTPNERHISFGKFTLNVYKKPKLGPLKKTLKIKEEKWDKTETDFDPSEAECANQAFLDLKEGNVLQYRREKKGQILCRIYHTLVNA